MFFPQNLFYFFTFLPVQNTIVIAIWLPKIKSILINSNDSLALQTVAQSLGRNHRSHFVFHLSNRQKKNVFCFQGCSQLINCDLPINNNCSTSFGNIQCDQRGRLNLMYFFIVFLKK